MTGSGEHTNELDKVYTIAHKIRTSKVENKEAYFSSIYSNFKKQYPILFEMCCSPNFDINILTYMIEKMKEVQNGENSFEETSKEVGQEMFDKYVAPHVPKKDT